MTAVFWRQHALCISRTGIHALNECVERCSEVRDLRYALVDQLHVADELLQVCTSGWRFHSEETPKVLWVIEQAVEGQ